MAGLAQPGEPRKQSCGGSRGFQKLQGMRERAAAGGRRCRETRSAKKAGEGIRNTCGRVGRGLHRSSQDAGELRDEAPLGGPRVWGVAFRGWAKLRRGVASSSAREGG